MEIHNLAKEKGWWDAPRQLPELLCLIHSEISEALEAHRNNIPEGEPGCLSEELADVVIRVWDLCSRMNIDIADAVERKHKYNMTRPYRHGGKTC